MSDYAVINSDTSICDNVIVGDEDLQWTPPPSHYIINIDGQSVGIGWSYDPTTQVWTPPPEPVPPAGVDGPTVV
jgi:hypothetical protein